MPGLFSRLWRSRWALVSLSLCHGMGCRSADRAIPTTNATRTIATVAPHGSQTGDALGRSNAITTSTRGDLNLETDGHGTRYFIPDNTDAPAFLLLLHGLGGSGIQFAQQLEMNELARDKRFAFAAPDGSVDEQGRKFWDAGPTCCNFSHRETNDLGRLRNIIQFAIAKLRVNPKRIVVIGYSNGGFMAHRLGCEFSSEIRAIVSIAAAGPGAREHCVPERPVAVLEIHGSEDKVVPFEGGHLFGRADFPESTRVSDGLVPWAKRNGCRGSLRVVERMELTEELPANETELLTYSDCAVPVQLWKMRGGGHILPLGAVAQNRIWAFIERNVAD
ncbi:MAG TPA: alpha/beta fold hydrolase [Polyangiaceae bacterium]